MANTRLSAVSHSPDHRKKGGDRSRSNSSYTQEEDISRLVECMALNTTSDEESEASEASYPQNQY
jgi:hypothetical protein